MRLSVRAAALDFWSRYGWQTRSSRACVEHRQSRRDYTSRPFLPRTCPMKTYSTRSSPCWRWPLIGRHARRRPGTQAHQGLGIRSRAEGARSRAARCEAQSAVRLEHRRRAVGSRWQRLDRQGRPRRQGHRRRMGHGPRLPEGPRALRRRQVAVCSGPRRHRGHRHQGGQDQGARSRSPTASSSTTSSATARTRCTCPTPRARRSTS